MNVVARPLSIATALLVAGSLLTSFGCEVTKTGEQGNLNFRYTADDRLIPPTFNRPVARGTRVEVQVTDADTNQSVTIVNASSDRTSVLTVPQRSGSRLTLAGEGAGNATLTVSITGSVSDTIGVEVADIDEVVLRNPGPLLTPVQGTPAVITNSDIPFGMELKDAAGRFLIGYGNIPVEIDPATAGTQVTSEDVAHVVLRFTEAGDVTVRPLNSTPIPIKVIAATDVASITLTPVLGTAPADIPLSQTSSFAIKGATADGDPVVGLADVATVTSESIAVCSIEPLLSLGDGVFKISPLAVGDCNLQATHNGQTATLTFKVIDG